MKIKFPVLIITALLILGSCSKSGPSNPLTPATTVPVLAGTSVASAITGTSALSGGTVSSDGGTGVTARGVCWSSTANPTTANTITADGTGSGSFTSNITGLTAGTLYYVRSYATNIVGTSYGAAISFTTTATTAPVIGGTTPVTGISDVTALSGGSITSDGGTAITARGVCWNTSSNPTTSNSKTSDGSGTGSFISNLTGLTASTVYYARTYATNTIGTTYGPEINFTTFLAIGSVFQGGKLTYILAAGDAGYDPNIVHGLITTASDVTTGANTWLGNGSYSVTGAIGTAIGTGNANTNTIVTMQGPGNYAAKLCADLVLNGYSDWYLPSKNELNKIFLNKALLGGVFSIFIYWSSSEYNFSDAWVQLFGSGQQTNTSKTNGGQIRAVRSF